MERATTIYKAIYGIVSDMDTTEKQSMAASIILTADVLATDWIFKDGKALAPEDIKDFLRSKDSVSVNERGYEHICQWVVQNAHRLCGTSTEQEVWGKIVGNVACIIRTKFNQAVADGGYNPQALLSWMKLRKLIETREKGYTKNQKINGHSTDCVFLVMSESENNESEDCDNNEQALPFDVDF
jgi:hypothetical protein